MPTIRDLSEYTGLAFGTVSKYLNGGNVRPENRAVLDEAVAKLHYRVNYAARTLKSKRSNTIGVVLPAASLPAMGAMLTALDRCLAQFGYATILCAYAQSSPEHEKLRLLCGNVDGIVMLPNSINASEIDELCGQMPVTLLDCVFPGAGYDSVLTDYLDLAYRAAEHLFSRQHTRIGAIIGAQNGFAVSELKTGLLRAFSDYQQTPDETLLLQSECGYAQGYELFMQLCSAQNPPSAIIVTDALLSMGAEAAANERIARGMRAIELVGIGEMGIHRIPGRRIPLFERSGEMLGETAAELLLDRLNGGVDTSARVRRIKSELTLPDM